MDTDERAIQPSFPHALLPCRLAVLAIVALHLFGDYFAIPVIRSLDLSGWTEVFIVCTFYGSIMGQLGLLVAYQAWGRDDWLRRWAKSIFLLVLCWTTLTAGARSTGDSFEISSVPELLANVMFGTFLCLTVPLWGARLLVGFRFDHVRPSLDAETSGRPRFHLRDLMVGTVGAAIVFAIMRSPVGREVLRPNWSISWNEITGLAVFVSLTTALCALAAIPTSWVVLGNHRWGKTLAGCAVYLAVVIVCEHLVMLAFDNRDLESWRIVAGFNLGVVAQVSLTAIVLRACGYRLRLHGKRNAHPAIDVGRAAREQDSPSARG